MFLTIMSLPYTHFSFHQKIKQALSSLKNALTSRCEFQFTPRCASLGNPDLAPGLTLRSLLPLLPSVSVSAVRLLLSLDKGDETSGVMDRESDLFDLDPEGGRLRSLSEPLLGRRASWPSDMSNMDAWLLVELIDDRRTLLLRRLRSLSTMEGWRW